jgi:hypothetical protein
LEIEALRKGLQATRDRVKALEAEVHPQKARAEGKVGLVVEFEGGQLVGKQGGSRLI